MKTKTLSILSFILSLSIIASSCDFLSNTDKGYVAGTIGGTILGAGLGAVIGGDYGADLGAHLGMAVGGVAGAAIGANEDAKQAQKASKAKTQAKAANPSTDYDTYYDKSTGLYYTKVSRDNGILFDPRSCDHAERFCASPPNFATFLLPGLCFMEAPTTPKAATTAWNYRKNVPRWCATTSCNSVSTTSLSLP